MKITLNYRNATWKKGLAAAVLLLGASLAFLAMGIAFRETVAIVLSALGVTLFGFFLVSLLNPNMLACMQMVKGEMSYKQLQQAIAAEDFERPIRFLQKDFRPGLFLVSDNWIVVEEHGNTVYVPKSKVRKIEMLMEPVEFGPEASGDVHTYLHFYNYFVFTCDEKHAFATGLISYDDAPEAMRVVQAHFPLIPIEEVHEVKEWKQ